MESRNHPFNHINLHHKHVWWPCVNIKLSGIRGRAYLCKVRGENSESVNHFELTKWYGCVDAQWHRNPQSVALVTTIEPKKVKYTKNASKQTKLAPHSQQVILCPINTGFTSSHWRRREGNEYSVFANSEFDNFTQRNYADNDNITSEDNFDKQNGIMPAYNSRPRTTPLDVILQRTMYRKH